MFSTHSETLVDSGDIIFIACHLGIMNIACQCGKLGLFMIDIINHHKSIVINSACHEYCYWLIGWCLTPYQPS